MQSLYVRNYFQTNSIQVAKQARSKIFLRFSKALFFNFLTIWDIGREGRGAFLCRQLDAFIEFRCYLKVKRQARIHDRKSEEFLYIFIPRWIFLFPILLLLQQCMRSFKQWRKRKSTAQNIMLENSIFCQ